MYVDDLVTGSNNLSEARSLQEEIIHILGKGGFALHKWCANHPDLLKMEVVCLFRTVSIPDDLMYV